MLKEEMAKKFRCSTSFFRSFVLSEFRQEEPKQIGGSEPGECYQPKEKKSSYKRRDPSIEGSIHSLLWRRLVAKRIESDYSDSEIGLL